MQNLEQKEYSAHGVHLQFPYGYKKQTTNARPKKHYLYQAIEVLTFEDFRVDLPPHAQQVMPRESLANIEQFIDTDSSLLGTAPLESKPKLGPTYAPLQPSFGNLASLYILPKISEKKIRQLVSQYVQELDGFQLTKIPVREQIGKHTVWKWRYQSGKSRYDHFLVLGENLNYLFVSSAYSAGNGGLEKMIKNLQLE
ncbi:MAG: hypothetical protein MK212_00350 [Saprospiraceae bacterium]|nr:hypothetical protein [Saprospiraceae bacterium]